MSEHNVVDEDTAGDGAEFRVILEVDESPDSPREWTNVSVVDCLTSRQWNVPQEGDSAIRNAIEEHSFPVVSRWLRLFHGATVVLPLDDRGFLYGGPDETPEVGNYFGVAYDTPESRKETGVFPEDIRIAMEAELSEYKAWAEGEVFVAIIERKCTCCDTWNSEDSVGGFIGADYAESEARRMLAETITIYETDNAIGPTDD